MELSHAPHSCYPEIPSEDWPMDGIKKKGKRLAVLHGGGEVRLPRTSCVTPRKVGMGPENGGIAGSCVLSDNNTVA